MAAFLVGDLIMDLVRKDRTPPAVELTGRGAVMHPPGPQHRRAPWWRRWRR
jgi:hypothetical protein